MSGLRVSVCFEICLPPSGQTLIHAALSKLKLVLSVNNNEWYSLRRTVQLSSLSGKILVSLVFGIFKFSDQLKKEIRKKI